MKYCICSINSQKILPVTIYLRYQIADRLIAPRIVDKVITIMLFAMLPRYTVVTEKCDQLIQIDRVIINAADRPFTDAVVQ